MSVLPNLWCFVVAALADGFIDMYLKELCALKEVTYVEEHLFIYSVHKNLLSAY